MERDDDVRISSKRERWQDEKGKRYIEKNKNRLPKKELIKLLNELKPGKAIELGTGAGNDTIYLLEKNWEVLSVDINEQSRNHINSLLDDEKRKRFSFKNQAFEDLEIEKESCDLIIGFDSMHFCRKEKFAEFFKKVSDAIKSKGYFIGNLIGVRDSWNNGNNKMPFFTREDIEKLFSEFDIEEGDLKEYEKDGQTTSSNPKHWHCFFIKARKK